MSLWLQIVLYVCGAAALVAILWALAKDGKPVRRLLSSGLQGLCALAAVNVTGALTGVSLGLGFFSTVCCVLLGIPGVIALLVAKMIVHI
ncbi:MAG: pro-sigmaK processing inhibitor BofA family protein [Oscillospiraceae bacterium]|nr:pro-sigmaK processing inhibitor BofA family protein [Oscillospiraceae bacterium]